MTDTTIMNPASPVEPAEDRLNPRHMLAFTIMVVGMFMSILDIQIVSASLAEIQAGLSASVDEVSWVQTSYLICEVIAIPLSGYLSRAFGTRNLFAMSAAGFTFASLMCGLTSSISQMIFWRAVQGFVGAGMIPTVFASAYTVFPRSKFHIVGPIIGLVSTLAPTVGPTVGGYLTDALSWHWLFFINIVPGIFVTLGVLALVDFDEPNMSLLSRLDWIGLAAMGGFLGSLEYVLEEGPRNDWFEESLIVIFTIVMLMSAAIFFYRAFTQKEPIVDLRTFGDRNFAVGCLISLCVGVGLYGLTYLYPRYLAEVRGYSAMMIGETMFVSGAVMFLSAPIIAQLLRKYDPRALIFIGLLLFSIGTWQMTWVTRDYDFWELFLPQVFRGAGIMLAMIPTNTIALGTLPPDRMKNASGLFNLTRNLGGAIGLALLNTILNKRTDLHLARLHEAVTWGNAKAVETLNLLTQKFQGTGDAAGKALKQLMMIVHRQAVVMSYADAFFVLTFFYLALAGMIFLLKKPAMMGAPPDAH